MWANLRPGAEDVDVGTSSRMQSVDSSDHYPPFYFPTSAATPLGMDLHVVARPQVSRKLVLSFSSELGSKKSSGEKDR